MIITKSWWNWTFESSLHFFESQSCMSLRVRFWINLYFVLINWKFVGLSCFCWKSIKYPGAYCITAVLLQIYCGFTTNMTSYFWTSGFKQEREFSHSATKKKKGVHVQQKISKATEEDYHASMSTDQRAGTNELAYTSIILHVRLGKIDSTIISL